MDTSRPPGRPTRGLAAWPSGLPFNLAMAAALLLGVLTGCLLGPSATVLRLPVELLLRLLRVIAPLLSLLALSHTLATTSIERRDWTRLAGLLAANTLAAAVIGLLAGNLARPGLWIHRGRPLPVVRAHSMESWLAFLRRIVAHPSQSLTDYYATLTLIVALALGFGLRSWWLRHQDDAGRPGRSLAAISTTALSYLPTFSGWMVFGVPVIVFCTAASNTGEHGLKMFVALAAFVGTVLLGLALQLLYYLVRLRFASATSAALLLRGGHEALHTAFATASSTVAMPVAYNCLTTRVKLRPESAGIGVLVGANFSKDGTVLYLAVAALFAAQAGGLSPGLSLQLQLLIALGSFLARAVTPGVPGAGFVTMTVVFSAVGLPLDYTPLLLTVDWLLDRCRSTVNLFGDMTVSCLLDAQTPAAPVLRQGRIEG